MTVFAYFCSFLRFYARFFDFTISRHTMQSQTTLKDSASFMQLTQTPLVSIIVPIFNVAPYLQQCLESILKQSYTNLDIILVDDGSSDESLDIALEFAGQDERIFVVSKPNGGLSSARNTGLEFIKGSALRGVFDNRACRPDSIFCHTERSEVSQNIVSLEKESRDSSVATQPQNDNINAQYDKISLTQNQIARSQYPAFVYIITNKTHSTLYIGVTSNLQRRIYEHKNHLAKGFSDKYNCEKLVYFESFDSIEQAIEKEKYLKGKKREFKENLINSINPQWLDLYEYLFGDISICHTELSQESEVSQTQMNNRDSSVASLPQNDKVKTAQYDNESFHTDFPTCHTELSQESEVSQIQANNIDSSLRASHSAQNDNKSCHTEPLKKGEVSQRIDNRDISLSTKAQYDKEMAQYDNTIKSLTQTHSFEKTYKTITAQEINAHFTQIAPNFIKSDLERINDFITQELPANALIHFVDSDDMITSDCIEICVQNLLAQNLDIAVHNWSVLDEASGQTKKGEYLANLKTHNYNTGLDLLAHNKIYDFYFSPQGLFRADILNRYALRYTEGIYHEDHDFGTLLFCLAGKVDYIDAPLYIYRARSGSITNNQKQAAFPAQIPSFLEPLRRDFKDYKSLRAYFRGYCFVRVGFNIWGFYESSLAQGQIPEFKMRYGRFFANVVLGYAMNICKIPLRNDPLGIKATLRKIRFQRRSVWRHYLKDLHRQPKKLRYIANIRWFY